MSADPLHYTCCHWAVAPLKHVL